MWESIGKWIGPDEQSFDLDLFQMVIRALVVFIIAVALARLGSKRFMARNSAFDLILAIMLGSVLSRAITGQSPFFPTLAAAAALVAMHGGFAWLASRSGWFGFVIKGRARELVKDGKIIPKAMKRHGVGEHDLQEALRMNGGGISIGEVESAHLERNGDISVIRRRKPPQVLEMNDGPERVIRIRLE
jgi:uncharacterized membrane protein YcaP (DUF421 family)